jgi:RNA polymerase sigma factor (sigma-70 family)
VEPEELISHLFRSEYRKITSVLCKLFGIQHIEIAEDIASDTFLHASEIWPARGIPENPAAWLYVVAKNKAKDRLKRDILFEQKIAPQFARNGPGTQEIEIDLSEQNIADAQLQMLFAICTPVIPSEAQIGLALRILCGFDIDEISRAFLTNKDTINKRLFRAKEKLKAARIKIEFPGEAEIQTRLDNVMTTLYLLFNEGYYSASQDSTFRKELCVEAMRLTHLLVTNKGTDTPFANALLSLMCFHASRFDARLTRSGETILYQDQNTALWDEHLVQRGEYYLNRAAQGQTVSKYHFEAGIAYWHTVRDDSGEKWEKILQLYNQLLRVEYSTAAALNRTYALSKANGKIEAIAAAEKLGLEDNHLFHALLGELYTGVNDQKAHSHLQTALKLAKSIADQSLIENKIALLTTV